MKKTNHKPLLLSTEKVRELSPDSLKAVIGGALNAYNKPCVETSKTG